MNWKQRVALCRLQIGADKRFGNEPIGGVHVKDSNNNTLILNSKVKTNWPAELDKALRKLDGNEV